MSDIERFEIEALAAMKKFFLEIENHVDWAIETIDTNRNFTGSFRQEMLRSTASTLASWQKKFEELKSRVNKGSKR
jgi:hypothetical protein